MESYWGSGGAAPHIVDLGTTWKKKKKKKKKKKGRNIKEEG
jgi:hypothetical protein